jgi:surface carbohydrate biosynthesis protein
MTSPLTLYIPIETIARELTAKVLLACIAVERGHRVVLGELRELRDQLPYLEPGVFIAKSIPEKMGREFQRYRTFGHHIAAWCEEGLVIVNRERYRQMMIPAASFLETDVFFTWGANQRAAILEHFSSESKRLVCAGNPRIDLLRPEFRGVFDEEVQQIRERLGRFILFNTNFSWANHGVGTEYLLDDLRKRGKIVSEEDENYFWTFREHKQRLMEETKKLIGQLAADDPDRLLVVRPHPSENHDTWKMAYKDTPNVHVEYSGSAAAWILAGDILIHNGCTTAVEGVLLGKPALAYRPVKNPAVDLELPNKMSIEVDSLEEVVHQLEALKRGELGSLDANKQAILSAYLDGIDGQLSSERICVEIERRFHSSTEPATSRLARHARRTKYQVREQIKGWVGRKPASESPSLASFRKQRFPGLDKEILEGVLQTLTRVSGRFEKIEVTRIRGTGSCHALS